MTNNGIWGAAFGSTPFFDPRWRYGARGNTNIQLKQETIQERAVMLWMVSVDKAQMVSQRRSTTLSNVAKISLRKPILRSSFQICSIGFISGVYGGIKNSSMLFGTQSDPALCHAAPSQQRRMMSSGYCFDNSSRKIFMHAVLQYGIMRKQDSPVKGSTAPYAYRYSLIWWHGTDGRKPFRHQQYFGLLIRPKPASSWNNKRTFFSLWKTSVNSAIRLLIFLAQLQSLLTDRFVVYWFRWCWYG